MMFRGTDKYPKEAYGEILKATGASANANTSLDRTVYHMTGNAALLETMFDLESDRFQKLKYSVQAFKTEAGAVKGEYTKNNASPYSQLNEATSNAAFEKHTYKHTTMGFIEDIVDMPNQYEFSLEFFDRFYRPEYCTIIVVGDVKQEQVNTLAEKYFGNWQRGKHTTRIPVEPEQKGVKYAHVKMAQFPAYLELNYKCPAFSLDNNDYHALSILMQILFSERSDLYKKLVVNEKILRSLSGSIYPTRDPYLLSTSASFVDQKIWHM
ncbi:MAG: insulinase family protein [Bacteroidetes bacterium]|nr:insulinase family protein [Bacteroidota bacterium]